MNNYMPLFYMDVIIYASPNLDAGLVKLLVNNVTKPESEKHIV